MYYLLFGKIVLDVGTGSGILAIWAAQAGAKKVYAVEATKMAEHARRLVAGNGVENIVEVIEGSIEDIDIPEKGIEVRFNFLEIINSPFDFSNIVFHDSLQLMSSYRNGWATFSYVNLCLIL